MNTSNGNARFENSVNLIEVMINEDFLNPDHESIALGFRNKDSSGLIELTPKEVNEIIRAFDKKKHLIKGVKIFSEKVR
ncbi:hypothetical protein COU57_01285 [Candidatus Pacearchaeota archaeon CG10_big_fil_rev_8_21_14_0_10_32_14]|nr:MAG: hypothetical protein COU57_01285 [Candidatus Pacearchaeota archaeon CG10_big_fil_rev_8_21_14_0_10_32_14]